MQGEIDADDNTNEDSDEDFNPTLAAMETEIKPKVLKQLIHWQKIYKAYKISKEKLECILNSQVFSPAKEKVRKDCKWCFKI